MALTSMTWAVGRHGVSSIYYLARDDTEALRFAGHLDDLLLKADHVLAHDMITVPHLSSLPDLVERRPVAVDVSMTAQIWPPMPQNPEVDLSWMAEPILERIADSLRDRVATIEPDHVDAILPDWTAELNGAVDASASGQLATDLVLLARRGRAGRLSLYNWYEL